MCWLCNYNINFLFDFDTVLICDFSQSIKSVSTDNCQMRVLLYAGCTSQGVAEHNVLFPSQQRCARVLSPSYVTELMLFFTGLELLTCMHKNTFSIGCGIFFFSKRSDSENDIPLQHVSEWKKCWKRSQPDD
jgi:hypothetical protein